MPKSSWRMKGGNGWQIPRPNQAWILSSSQASRWPLICSMTWWKHNSNSPVPLQADMSLIFFGKPLHHCKGSRSPKWWCKASTCPWHKSGCQWTRNFQSREIKWQPAFTLPTLVYTNKHLHQLLQKKQKQLKCFDQGPNPQLSNLLLQPTVAGGFAWRQTNIDNISMVSVVRHTHTSHLTVGSSRHPAFAILAKLYQGSGAAASTPGLQSNESGTESNPVSQTDQAQLYSALLLPAWKRHSTRPSGFPEQHQILEILVSNQYVPT